MNNFPHGVVGLTFDQSTKGDEKHENVNKGVLSSNIVNEVEKANDEQEEEKQVVDDVPVTNNMEERYVHDGKKRRVL